jgi:multidrug efflux pump subunit AcrA (membrane-fusion protein)
MAPVPPAWAGPGAHGPNGEHLDTPAVAANPSGLARLPDGSVNVPKAAQRRMAIRTLLAPEGDAAVTVEMPGRVVTDPNASGRVQALHGGRIEPGPKGLPVAGQSVRRGDVLAYVRHHAEPYAAALQQARLSELRAQREVAQQRVQRLEAWKERCHARRSRLRAAMPRAWPNASAASAPASSRAKP